MSFCDISLSWGFDASPSTITSFTFKEASEDFIDPESADSKHCDALDDVTPETDFDEFKHQGKNPITVTRPTESDDTVNCLMRVTCRNPNSSRLNGLTVVSESRTLEISNDVDGYLKSVRGRALMKDSDESKSKDSDTKLYVCQCLFSDIYSNLNIKFLSLGERASFTIHSIIINISQNPNVPTPSTGTFDMDKLRKNVTEMGDSVPAKAKDFLTMLGQYKQTMQMNQMSMLSQLQQTAAASMPTLPPMGPNSSSRNPAVAEMFSRIEAMAPPQSSPYFPIPSSGQGGLPSVEAPTQQSQPASCPYMAGNLGLENASSSIPPSFLNALLAGSPHARSDQHAPGKATADSSAPHPLLAALMAGATAGNNVHQAEGASSTSVPHLPQHPVPMPMAHATDQLSSQGSESNLPAQTPQPDSNPNALLATLMKGLQVSNTSRTKSQAGDDPCRQCGCSIEREENLVRVMSSVEESTQALTRQMEQFKQDILSELSKNKSDVDKRLDSMEEKLQRLLDS